MKRFFSAFNRFSIAVIILAVASCSEETPVSPGGNGDGNDTIPVPVIPDTIAPAAIDDARLEVSQNGGFALLSWSAPHDDAPDEAVHHYEIRYAYTRGYPPPAFWELSTPILDAPTPEAPGVEQSYLLTDLNLGRDLWFGIRSYDAAGNVSEPSELVMAHVPGLSFSGRCIDALTGTPIEGLDVRVASGGAFDVVTDADGRFVVEDLLPGGSGVEIKTGSTAIQYHRLNQIFVIEENVTHTFYMIPYQTTIAPELDGMTRLAFLKLLTETDRSNTVLAKWRSYPVQVYIPPLVNSEGVDYAAISREAAQRWMDRSGKPLFTFVSSAPDTGITVSYRDRADIAPLVGVTVHTVDALRHPITDEIRIVNDLSPENAGDLLKVMIHEFGHTIRFGHLDDGAFMMYASLPLPEDISEDEVNAVRLHYGLPTRVDMTIYTDSP